MRYTVGIDEVGRGSLAGPVTVAAVCVPKKIRIRNYELGKLKDSKKLTASRRERWFYFLKNHPKIRYAIARVYPRAIEKMNVSRAANLAALRAFRRLIATTRYLPHTTYKVYLDGGLYLGNGGENVRIGARKGAKNIRNDSRLLSQCSASTIIRGDEKIKAIAAASIIAKVSRDRAMTRLAKKYPQYGFEIHKGYGTRKHFAAIRKHGPSEAHRKTFI
jgi:ribonuclease HII